MKTPSALKQLWHEWLQPLAVMAAIICPIKSSLADYNFVPTGSMKPTILEGDLVFVNKLAYDLKIPFTTVHLAEWNEPSRGDIVVLFSPEDGLRLVKRIVAVPGDTVELRNNMLRINGQPARYSPLPSAVTAGVPATERAVAKFATETIGERSHAVMVHPFLPSPRCSVPPLTLRAGEYFVMGDNRDNSKDSRYFGVVDRRLIVGKANAVIASVDKNGSGLPRFGRFFSALR
ncbi:MAG: signal peptidase I [Verrucomicrobia bacterium]|nr:signal peptidase I [Verrucomicrobiota bacterium]